MPWNIHKSGDQFCVHKKGSSTPVPGGCHKTREQAMNHMQALYANEPMMGKAQFGDVIESIPSSLGPGLHQTKQEG